MKKVTYLLLVMFAIVLMSTSCEKDETLTKTDEHNEGLITLTQLDGKWYVESYLYDGITWLIGTNVPPEYNLMDNIFDYDWDFNTQDMTAKFSETGFVYNFSKNENVIKISDATNVVYTYTVISYSANQLKVIFEDNEDDTSYFPYKGGTITFVR